MADGLPLAGDAAAAVVAAAAIVAEAADDQGLKVHSGHNSGKTYGSAVTLQMLTYTVVQG